MGITVNRRKRNCSLYWYFDWRKEIRFKSRSWTTICFPTWPRKSNQGKKQWEWFECGIVRRTLHSISVSYKLWSVHNYFVGLGRRSCPNGKGSTSKIDLFCRLRLRSTWFSRTYSTKLYSYLWCWIAWFPKSKVKFHYCQINTVKSDSIWCSLHGALGK